MALLEAKVPEGFAATIAALADASGETRSEVLRRLLLRSLREMAAGERRG